MHSEVRVLIIWLLAACLFGLGPALAETSPGADDSASSIRGLSRLKAPEEPIAQIRDGYLILKGGTTINLSTLPTGESLVIDVIVDIDNPLPGGTTELSSQVDVAGSNFTTEPSDDPATGADDDATITGVAPGADLQITKTDGSATAIPGQTVSYTIVASNAGPVAVTDATVTDNFPAALTGCNYTSVAAGGATGNTALGAGNIADTLNLPNGASVTYSATCFIDSAATGSLVNTATITSALVPDPDGANNSATDTDTLTVTADLEITKTNGISTSVPGQQTTYTIIASNQGPSTVTDAAVADTFPAALTNCNYTSIAPDGATGNTAAGSGDIADSLNMPPESSVTYTVTCDIDEGATGNLVNTATISSVLASETDPGDNSATDTDTLEVTADLEITKTNGVTSSIPGQQTIYTIVASNQGPSTVTDASVVDNFPASLTCNYTSVAAGGATGNTAAGAGNIADTLSLPSGSSVTYTATCDIDEAATGSLVNTATISSVIATETDAGDNSATDTDSLTVTADLGITKDNGGTTSVPGQQTVYTIVASNAGPSTVTDAVVSDTFAAPLANCTYTSVAAGGATGNTAAGAGDLADTLTLPASSMVTYTVTCDIDAAATGNLSNTATISSVLATDGNAANDSATDTDTLEVTADLEITKDNSEVIVSAGSPTTYTITATNQGPSTVTDAAIADAFPAELINCTYTSVAAGGATGNTAAGSGDIADTVDMPPGSSVTYTATCDVDPNAVGTVVNTATISSAIATETDPGDNSATDSDPILAQADLSLEKTASPTFVAEGDPVTYTITVTNNGPGDAENVVVTDMLPAGVTLVSTTGCAEDPVGVPTCTLGNIAASMSAQFTIDVTVDPAPPATIINTASVTADNADPNPGDNSDTATLTSDAVPPQVVSVSVDSGPLAGCDSVSSNVTRLEIVFNEPMTTSGLLEGPPPPEADLIENYWLVRPGADRSFDTTACGALSGDDFLVPLGGISYDPDTPMAPEATVTLDKPTRLRIFTDDLYRLIVCGNIADAGGNPLDGDGDGNSDGTDDFVIDFRLDRLNRFENGNFDCDLNGWDIDPPGSLQVTHSAEDFEDSQNSGSGQAAFATEEAFGFSQCVPIEPIDRPYRLSSRVRVDAGAGVQVVASRSCIFFDQTACAGNVVDTEQYSLFLVDTGGAYQDRDPPFEFDIPDGSMSAACGVDLQSLDDAVLDAFVDGLYVGFGDDPIFDDGFESGDVSAWGGAAGN